MEGINDKIITVSDAFWRAWRDSRSTTEFGAASLCGKGTFLNSARPKGCFSPGLLGGPC